MEVGHQLKPQDILVLLKILTTYKAKPWRYSELAKELHMSQSEVHSAIKRAEQAKLFDPLTRRPIRGHLIDYIVSGIRYAYPALPGKEVVGTPTAHSAPPLNQAIISEKRDIYVWPVRTGKSRGYSIQPLYRSVPVACAKDEDLYRLFTLIDALRVGRTREVDLSKKLITEIISTL